MKLTKKQELALSLLDFKSVIEECVAADTSKFDAWTHTIWTCHYTYNGAYVACHGGETSRYWFDKRICASELRGMMKGNPKTEYFVFRRGAKRPQYTIIAAAKYAVEPEKPVLVDMTPSQVKDAVLAGKTVHWMSDLYTVAHRNNEWNLDCDSSESTWGLIKADGTFANHDGKNFFVA
jgi:hypothetical protein